MIDLSPATTWAFLLLLIRTSGLVVAGPVFSMRGIPAWTKTGFAVFCALVLVPLQAEQLPAPPQTFGEMSSGIIRETLFGLALGLAMMLVYIGLQMGASLAGLQMGFGLGGVFDPVSGNDFGSLGPFYSTLVTLIFFTVNAHHLIIQTLAETAIAIPPGTFDPLSIRADELAPLVAGLTITAVRIAMPIVAAMLLADVGLGFVARTTPQVNVLVIGQPIKILVGLIVLGASLPVTMQLMAIVLGDTMAGSSARLLGAH